MQRQLWGNLNNARVCVVTDKAAPASPVRPSFEILIRSFISICICGSFLIRDERKAESFWLDRNEPFPVPFCFRGIPP